MEAILLAHRERYPLMTEEDTVKLVFQGLLGVGHLIRSEADAIGYLHAEMAALEPDGNEPLTEWVGPRWFRLNLRKAKALGLAEAEIARMLLLSAGRNAPAFSRRDVYDLCVRLDGSARMRAAAERLFDETWLPSHSERYRAAYRPAYRVLHAGFLPPGAGLFSASRRAGAVPLRDGSKTGA